MEIKKQKTIGILGGMGPVASANLYYKIITVAQDKYLAEQDYDYPPFILYSLPLVGFDETGFVDPELVKNQLIAGVKRLESAGSDFIIVACNTVHYFQKEMQEAIDIPFLSIIDETVKAAKETNCKIAGLLSSESTAKLDIYKKSCEQYGISIIPPTTEQQAEINQVILNVMAGAQGKKDTRVLHAIIEDMRKKGAEVVILGCTEIPLAIHQDDVEGIQVLDSTQIITESALHYAREESETNPGLLAA